MAQFDALEWLACFGWVVGLADLAEWFNRHTNYSVPGPTGPPVPPLPAGALRRAKVI